MNDNLASNRLGYPSLTEHLKQKKKLPVGQAGHAMPGLNGNLLASNIFCVMC